jgi:hypothetical protein
MCLESPCKIPDRSDIRFEKYVWSRKTKFELNLVRIKHGQQSYDPNSHFPLWSSSKPPTPALFKEIVKLSLMFILIWYRFGTFQNVEKEIIHVSSFVSVSKATCKLQPSKGIPTSLTWE